MAEQTNHIVTAFSQVGLDNLIPFLQPEVQRWILFRLETQIMKW